MHDDPLTLLAHLAAALPHSGAERSFKMTHGLLLTQRILYGIDKKRMTQHTALSLAARLHMPDGYRQILGACHGAANFFYLGFEQDAQRSLWKWYLEFPVYVGTPQHGRPALLYVGLKWNAVDDAPIAITHYVWRVHLPLPELYACLGSACGSTDSATAHCATAVLTLAATRTEADRLVLLEVSEPGQARRSFDLNLYAASLTVGAVAHLLHQTAQHLAIPVPVMDALLTRIHDQPLGHLAGGLDRHNRDFLTLYYEI
ncbi:MAG: hypothetical protein HQL87_05310 [Magnetococcales bacterium]|nr:hypothetical protein [Magnetococcales bacterium]